MARRIIVCDGAELARLWARIGAGEDEVLTWVPRDDEPRARPLGFHALQGGLVPEAIEKLDPGEDDSFALVSEDVPFSRAALVEIARSIIPQLVSEYYFRQSRQTSRF